MQQLGLEHQQRGSVEKPEHSHAERPTIGTALTVDLVSGLATSLAVSPIVTIIDRSIISNASGRMCMAQSLKEGFVTLASKPLTFARQPSFLAVFLVYSGTYVTANSVESLCLNAPIDPIMPKFIASTAVNISLCVWKDKQLAGWFGTGSPRPFPKISYGLFSSFTLPPIISKILQGPEIGASKAFSDTICQLGLPCAVQLISTPIHLFGLDAYNRSGVSFGERVRIVKRDYVTASVARMCRILPAFGIGGVVNTHTRAHFGKVLR
ncbi:hypothetical protein BDR26DRAFT_851404 [Obelidium mucronatum]|nr:hypothetical protein BDR26DRAFT_851404 [Obelidium mucronatum]